MHKNSKVAGRKAVHVPGHPKANSSGYVLQYRLRMEEKLGRNLSSKECVHHKDGNDQNNAIENLEVLSRSQHMSLHWKEEPNRFAGRGARIDKAALAILRSQGYGYKKIATALKCSRAGAQYVCKMLNI
jgi:hypothetical protein